MTKQCAEFKIRGSTRSPTHRETWRCSECPDNSRVSIWRRDDYLSVYIGMAKKDFLGQWECAPRSPHEVFRTRGGEAVCPVRPARSLARNERALHRSRVMVVSFLPIRHLDRFYGLHRGDQLLEDPFDSHLEGHLAHGTSAACAG